MSITFFLGGARSGKSTMAERLATDIETQEQKSVIYVATASQSDDQEMQSRIEHHRQSRPQHWQTIEQELDLASSVQQYRSSDTCVLIDCLTLWLSNWLCRIDSADNESLQRLYREQWQQQKQNFLAALQLASEQNQTIILVSNEVGHGIVPIGKLSRQFVDESGWLHQAIANIANEVHFVMAGLSLNLKTTGAKS